MTPDANTSLRWSVHAQALSNRTLRALAGAGITTWGQLVTEASRTPNCIRGIDKLGPKGVNEILIALNGASIPHTIRTRGVRGGHTPRR